MEAFRNFISHTGLSDSRGPPGTGKTETLKDLGYYCGMVMDCHQKDDINKNPQLIPEMVRVANEGRSFIIDEFS